MSWPHAERWCSGLRGNSFDVRCRVAPKSDKGGSMFPGFMERKKASTPTLPKTNLITPCSPRKMPHVTSQAGWSANYLLQRFPPFEKGAAGCLVTLASVQTLKLIVDILIRILMSLVVAVMAKSLMLGRNRTVSLSRYSGASPGPQWREGLAARRTGRRRGIHCGSRDRHVFAPRSLVAPAGDRRGIIRGNLKGVSPLDN